jgi:hypothetical protein
MSAQRCEATRRRFADEVVFGSDDDVFGVGPSVDFLLHPGGDLGLEPPNTPSDQSYSLRKSAALLQAIDLGD